MTEGMKRRMAAAHSPAARAKRAATMARKKAEREKLTEGWTKVGDETPAMHSIPLSAIPGEEPKKKRKQQKRNRNAEAWANANSGTMTREKAAMEIVRLTMWLADPRNQ
jgi:hypothetical protein